MDMMHQITKEKGVKIQREFPRSIPVLRSAGYSNQTAESSKAENFLPTYATVSMSRTPFHCVQQ
jgi:hypothetical protein